MRLGDLLCFMVLLAGLAVHGTDTAMSLLRTPAYGRTLLLPGRFVMPGGEVVTGYRYLGDTAAFLQRETEGRAPSFIRVLAENGDAGFWLSYLAYPRLVRFVPFVNAKIVLRRLTPGRHLLVVVPPVPPPGGTPSPWKDRKLRSLLSDLTGGAEPVLRHASPFGPRIYEVRR